ncbi:MAG: metallophosphoesterase family protein [Candidatus Xenobia bacterium]
MADRAPIRLAAVADLHVNAKSKGALSRLMTLISQQADFLLMAGDLTDYGSPEEAHILAAELASSALPKVAVLGNHDYETGHQDEVMKILRDAGVEVLDGEAVEIRGVGFAGTKGFGGGFGPRSLGMWGEPGIKRFVQEAVDEALKLETALARMRAETRVVLLHYSPIEATVLGEPREIFPFLGSSRLEEPLNRYEATVCFHGHAHKGSMQGHTATGIPVFNVAMPVLRRDRPEEPPFLLYEVKVAEPTPTG